MYSSVLERIRMPFVSKLIPMLTGNLARASILAPTHEKGRITWKLTLVSVRSRNVLLLGCVFDWHSCRRTASLLYSFVVLYSVGDNSYKSPTCSIEDTHCTYCICDKQRQPVMQSELVLFYAASPITKQPVGLIRSSSGSAESVAFGVCAL